MKQALEAFKDLEKHRCLHYPNIVKALEEALAKQDEPVTVTHRHEWFRTGEMKVGQMRCISCGAWGQEDMPQQRTWVGLNHDEVPEQYKYAQLWLKRIDEAIQAEREACAKVCESLSLEWEDQPNIAQAEVATKMDCAQAIRARGGEEARIKRLEKYLIRRTI